MLSDARTALSALKPRLGLARIPLLWKLITVLALPGSLAPYTKKGQGGPKSAKNKNMRLTITITILLLAGFATSVSLNAQQYSGSSQSTETGIAIYYADYLHGRITAMGETYQRDAYTAAHPRHPKGTLLRVTRLDNGLSTVVRVNDRGPYNSNAIIDVSKVAAMDIGLVKDGRAQVRVEVIGQSDTNPRGGQLSASRYSEKAAEYSSYPQQPAAYSSYPQQPAAYNSYSQQPAAQPQTYSSYPSAAAGTSYRRADQLTAKGGAAPSSYSTDSGRIGQQQPQYPQQRYAPATPGRAYYENQDGSLSDWEKRVQPTSPSQAEFTARSPGNARPQSYNQVSGDLAARSPGNTRNSASGSITLPTNLKGYALQLGSYSNASNANRQAEDLRKKGFKNAYVWQQGGFSRVVLASFAEKNDAQRQLDDLRRQHLMDGMIFMLP